MKNPAKLLEFADFLEAVPEGSLDINYWVRDIKKRDVVTMESAGCGTTFCVGGWAVVWAGREFLRFEHFASQASKEISEISYMLPNNTSIRKAAAEILELEDWEAGLLFTPSAYSQEELHNPKLAADHIRRFVEAQTRFDRQPKPQPITEEVLA